MRLVRNTTTAHVDAAENDPDARDVTRATGGDAAAFERIYRRHAARIFILAKRSLGADLAEDALQDVFVHAWDRLGQFRGDALFGSWLYRLAVNVVMRQAVTVRRIAQRVSAGDVDSMPAARSTIETVIDVDAALAKLSEETRIVVVLHDIEGFGHNEIADTLGISISASKMRLPRGRMQLREWLIS